MGKIYSQIIQNWSGGMTNLLRQNNINFARKITHFDIFSDPTKLKPYPDFAATTTDSGTIATIKLVRFLAAEAAANGAATVYALGQSTVTANAPKIYQKTTIAGAWDAALGTNGSDVMSERVMVEYKRNLLGWRSDVAAPIAGAHLDGSTSKIWRYPTTTGTWATAWTDATINTALYVAKPIVHSKDDRLYIPFDNYIYYHTGANMATDPSLGLTLPTNLVITSICEYGNYLAIACRSKIPMNRNSVVFLWDRDVTLTTVSESIDFGPEDIELIDVLDGVLVGISVLRNSYTDLITFDPYISFKYYPGGIQSARQFLQLPFSVTGQRIIDSQKINNRLLFMMSGTLDGDSTQTDGIWSLTKNPNGFGVTIEYLYNNATAITSGIPKGFLRFGDFVIAAFTDGGTYKVNQLTSGTFATAAASYETVIFNGGDAAQTKKFLKGTLITEPLPAAGSATLAYKADAETSYTTILTSSTDNDIRKDAVNAAGGANLPEFQEKSYQITSTGNAVITGLKVIYEEVEGKDNT